MARRSPEEAAEEAALPWHHREAVVEGAGARPRSWAVVAAAEEGAMVVVVVAEAAAVAEGPWGQTQTHLSYPLRRPSPFPRAA